MAKIFGALFNNSKKESGSNQPDYTGIINIDDAQKHTEFLQALQITAPGTCKIEVAGWKKTAKSGAEYVSLSFSVEPNKPPF